MTIRRSFDTALVTSAKFIKMPCSTQVLYFHLTMNTDDKGIVDAFKVMRLIGSCDDDLKILVAKQFITVLNEDLLTLVAHRMQYGV